METLSNLAREVQLLKAQLDLFRAQSSSLIALQSETLGVRRGDYLLCTAKAFGAVVSTFMQPAAVTVHAAFGKYSPVGCTAAFEVVVQPDVRLARQLVSDHPGKLVANTEPELFFRSLAGGSVDRIVIQDNQALPPVSLSGPGAERLPDRILQSLSEGACAALREARRIARRQIVVTLGGIPSNGLSQPLSKDPELAARVLPLETLGATPSLDSATVIVVANVGEGFDAEPTVQEYALIWNCETSPKSAIRAIILSREAPEFQFSPNDIIICDIDVAEAQFGANRSAGRSIVVVPLKILRTALSLPLQVLRSSVMNFVFLEGYLETLGDVVPVGEDAEIIVNELRSRIALAAVPTVTGTDTL